MISAYKKVRKLQILKSSYRKLKKKLCKQCNKGLAENIVNELEVKEFVFCSECEFLTHKVINLQSEIDETENKDLVQKFNDEKKMVANNE